MIVVILIHSNDKNKAFSRSAEIVSSMDVFPTLSALAGAPLLGLGLQGFRV